MKKDKEQLRAAMPFTASLVDSHREIFGDLNGIKATENNHKVQWRKSAESQKRKGDLAGEAD